MGFLKIIEYHEHEYYEQQQHVHINKAITKTIHHIVYILVEICPSGELLFDILHNFHINGSKSNKLSSKATHKIEFKFLCKAFD